MKKTIRWEKSRAFVSAADVANLSIPILLRVMVGAILTHPQSLSGCSVNQIRSLGPLLSEPLITASFYDDRWKNAQ